MRPAFLLIVTLIILISCKSPVKGPNGVVYQDAKEYNDYIVKRQMTIISDIMNFADLMTTNIDSAEMLLDMGVVRIENATIDLSGMPPYNGDTTLRNAAVNSFGFYKDVFQNEYKQIVAIRRKGDMMDEADREKLNELVERITIREEKFDKAFRQAQNDFARKNRMELRENEMQRSVDELGNTQE